MGWTPKRTDDDGTGSDAGSASSPTPSRRRKRRTAVVDAGTSETPLVDKAIADSPRAARGTRPRGGVHSSREELHGEDDRTQIKVRLGKRWSEIIMAVKMGEYTWADFVEGLDEEELARAQLRDVRGGFMGRPPALVPREFHLACQREMKRRFEELFGSEVLGLTRDFLALCKDKNIPPKDRAKLLQYAMERVFGGIPKDVRVSAEQPWEQMVVNVMRGGDDSVPEHVQRRYAGYQERMGGGTEA